MTKLKSVFIMKPMDSNVATRNRSDPTHSDQSWVAHGTIYGFGDVA